ncbi:MAG: hypothetical protein IPJ14_14580 [Kineosporiaceae bacterium]|nr:hypothetical protein [Kineosporiaceae bacterium]
MTGLSGQDVLSAVGALGALSTVATATMFYFGWRRSDVQARLMGIDVSLFGFSAHDYILRSLSSLYLPLLVLCGLGLGWFLLHLRVVRVVSGVSGASSPPSRRRRTAAAWALGVAATAGIAAAGSILFSLLAGLTDPPIGVRWLAVRLRDSAWVVPLVTLVATLTGVYAGWIHRRLRAAHATPTTQTSRRPLLPQVLVGGTVMLSTFWLLEEYASAVGRGYAQQLAHSVDQLSRTVVISPRPLGIRALGVQQERVGTTDSPSSPATVYRTMGLRLLARSGGKVILVHDGWNLATGTVIVLPDSDDLQWEFSR